VTSFETAPAQPRAGRPFSVRLRSVRSDTGAPVTTGRVACIASVGGKRLPAFAGRFVGRAAVCRYRIPADAGKKRLRGSIAVTSAGLTVARTFSRRIS